MAWGERLGLYLLSDPEQGEMHDRGKRSTDLGMGREEDDQERIVWAGKAIPGIGDLTRSKPSPCTRRSVTVSVGWMEVPKWGASIGSERASSVEVVERSEGDDRRLGRGLMDLDGFPKCSIHFVYSFRKGYKLRGEEGGEANGIARTRVSSTPTPNE